MSEHTEGVYDLNLSGHNLNESATQTPNGCHQ